VEKRQRHGILDIAPLNDAQYRFTTLEEAADWHWLAIVLRRKLVAPIARATDFGPAVMQPDVLRPSQPR